MTTAEINEKLFELLEQQFGDNETLQKSTVYTFDKITFEQLNADSLDVVELVMAVEEEFAIQIPDADLPDQQYPTFTVENAVDYIYNKLHEQK